MNQLIGYIQTIQEIDGIAFLKVKGEGFILGVMALRGGLSVGERVRALFKESDVMVAHGDKISARNKFLSPVRSIAHNGILARVEFEFVNSPIRALISYEALQELNITEGEKFYWFVKSNEIFLERGE